MQLAASERTSRRKTARRKKRASAPAPPGAKYLTATQAAEYIQRSPRTLKRWRSKGGGPLFVRMDDGEVRYPIAQLDEYMSARAGSEPDDFKPYQPAVVGRR